MHRIKQLILRLFSFSKTEANGSVVLIMLIAFCIASPALYKSLFGLKYSSYDEDRELLDSLVALLHFEAPSNESLEIELRSFNPNEASVLELKSLGVPEFLGRRIDNFRKAGGRFNIKSDLAKIYDFPDSLYQSLVPYIDLPDKTERNKVALQASSTPVKAANKQAVHINREDRYKEAPLLIDINLADSLRFQKLYGIGSGYSRRLVSFREALGGYHSVEQVRDLYGMSDSLYYQIRSFLTVSDTVTLQVIPINVATFQQLNAHPYISYELTKEILAAKSKYGKFKRLEDLNRLTLLDSLSIAKLGPYLKF